MAPWNDPYDTSRDPNQIWTEGKSAHLDDTQEAGVVARDYLQSLGHEVRVWHELPPFNERYARELPDLFLGIGAGSPFKIPHHEGTADRRTMGVETTYPVAWIGGINLTSYPWSAFYRAFVRGQTGDVKMLAEFAPEDGAPFEDRQARDTLIKGRVDAVLGWFDQSGQSTTTRLSTAVNADAPDVFVCYRSRDFVEVQAIVERLKDEGLTVFWDEEDIRPGTEHQPELKKGLDQARAVAVFFGPNGIGPWQSLEVQEAIAKVASEGRPTIPVLLPSCSQQPDLPFAMGNLSWADFRSGNFDDALKKLLWGITGHRPTDL